MRNLWTKRNIMDYLSHPEESLDKNYNPTRQKYRKALRKMDMESLRSEIQKQVDKIISDPKKIEDFKKRIPDKKLNLDDKEVLNTAIFNSLFLQSKEDIQEALEQTVAEVEEDLREVILEGLDKKAESHISQTQIGKDYLKFIEDSINKLENILTSAEKQAI